MFSCLLKVSYTVYILSLLINLLQLLELKGNVRVFCRCRPDEQDLHILSFSEEGLISCPTLQGKLKTYEFDKVFDPLVTQETVSES